MGSMLRNDGELRFVEDIDRFGRSKWHLEISIETPHEKLFKRGSCKLKVKKYQNVEEFEEHKLN